MFIALASHAPSLKSYRSVAGWLYSTAWNVARRKRTARDTRRLHEQRLIPATTSDMHVPLLDEELSDLYRALRMLPPDYLYAMVLHHLEGMTIAEVGGDGIAASSTEQTKTFAGKLNDIESTFAGTLNDIDWSSGRSGSVAVPEPSMLSLLGGLAMLAARRPRRRA